MPIRYGVIGTSWITRSMIDGAKKYPQLQLMAVCSRTKERGETFAAEVGAPLVYTDPATMAAADTIDMVYIASPNSCHIAQARLFLEQGKHVLCEKPLSAKPEEVAELQQLAAQKGVLFREAIMMLYQPQRQLLKQAVEDCGQISVAHFDFCQLSSKYDAYCRGEVPNIFNPALHTGALMDLGVYCVYPALYLFGEPTTVSATATFLRTGADGAGSALLHYPDKQVVLTYSKTAQSVAPSQIVGDKGTVCVNSISKLEGITFTAFGGESRELWGSEDKETLMGREIAAFADEICGKVKALTQADGLALAVSRRMQDIRKSAGIRFPGTDEV